MNRKVACFRIETDILLQNRKGGRHCWKQQRQTVVTFRVLREAFCLSTGSHSQWQNTMQSEEQQSISQNCKIVRCEPLRRLQRVLLGGKIIQWRSEMKPRVDGRCRRRYCCCCWSEEAAPQQARRLWWIEHKILTATKESRNEQKLY